MQKYSVDKNKFKLDKDKDKYGAYDNNNDLECLCNKKCILVVVFLILAFFVYLFYLESIEEKVCLGEKCKIKTCKAMRSNLISGTLCMDLCVYNLIDLDACVTSTNEQSTNYRFFSMNDPPDSAIMCGASNLENIIENVGNYYSKPHENINIADFEQMVIDLISSKLDYFPRVIELTHYLFDFADINRDETLSLAEAKTLWSLLNNKHTFYILILHNRHYVPRIQRHCGDVVELEQLTSTYLYSIKEDSILPTIFPNSYKWLWPKWEYRVKLILGILEFYLDNESFNPNEEYGKNSLYLCSSIESSFGYTYAYDVKLLNYEELYTASELQSKLSDRYCTYDTDCVYSSSCIAKCDKKINRCSLYLAEPQLVNLCKFIKIYLMNGEQNSNITDYDNKNLKHILKRCYKLGNVTSSDSIFSFAFSKSRSFYNNKIIDNESKDNQYDETINNHLNLRYSLEYSLVANELKSLLWSFIKYTKDPPKPKRITTQTTTTSTSQPGDGGKK